MVEVDPQDAALARDVPTQDDLSIPDGELKTSGSHPDHDHDHALSATPNHKIVTNGMGKSIDEALIGSDTAAKSDETTTQNEQDPNQDSGQPHDEPSRKDGKNAEREPLVVPPKTWHFDIKCSNCDSMICSELPSTAPPPPPDDPTSPSGDEPKNEEPDELPKPPSDRAYIAYKSVYVDASDDDEVLFDSVAYEPTPRNAVDEAPTSGSVFDIIKRYKAVVHIPKWERYRSQTFTKPPRSDSKPTYSLLIRSKAIIRAFQNAIQFYPGVELFKDSIKLEEPFPMLVHHFDDLVAYREARDPAHLDDTACDTARQTYEHLGMLLDFLEQNVMPVVRMERERLAKGFATWEMLWMSLRPGTDVARLTFSGASADRRNGVFNRDGAVIESVIQDDRSSPWEVKTWDLRYNGDTIGRQQHTDYIFYFDGEVELSKIAVVPIQHAPDAPDKTSAKEYLTRKGARYFKLLTPQFKHHRGQTLEYPFHQMEAQVQVDFLTFFDLFSADRPSLSEMPKGPKSVTAPECDCPSCATPSTAENIAAKFSNYNNIIPEVAGTLTSHQYFLCGQAVWAYMFKIRDWQLVDVDNLSEAEFRPGMIDTLVVEPKRLKLLKALSQSFMRGSGKEDVVPTQPWTADFVKGKGNSQIFLLHGPPGVGKTYTAECMAEHTCRPLMTLTSSDIGTTPAEVEKSLQHNFKLAKKWQAILLIDEADIYLERRSLTDLTRNSLVASFLRALEFYEGILFLTTNRVGSFDDAFVSRIHVKLHYPALSETDREQIWDNFINKLKNDRGGTMRVMRDVKEYVTSSKVRELRLNGREIRNVFQTAVGLAEFEGDRDEEGRIKVSEDHLAQVADMTGEFKKYLDELHLADEEKRAQKMFLRKEDNMTSAPTPDRRR